MDNGTESVDVSAEAKRLLGSGNRHLVMGDIPSAVNAFQEACSLLSGKYGETADECGEAYFLYGKSLLELARMENGVLGNALEGVPEEDEGETPDNAKIESTDKVDEKERDHLREQVYDAMGEKENPEGEAAETGGAEDLGKKADGDAAVPEEKAGKEKPKAGILEDGYSEGSNRTTRVEGEQAAAPEKRAEAAGERKREVSAVESEGKHGVEKQNQPSGEETTEKLHNKEMTDSSKEEQKMEVSAVESGEESREEPGHPGGEEMEEQLRGGEEEMEASAEEQKMEDSAVASEEKGKEDVEKRSGREQADPEKTGVSEEKERVSVMESGDKSEEQAQPGGEETSEKPSGKEEERKVSAAELEEKNKEGAEKQSGEKQGQPSGEETNEKLSGKEKTEASKEGQKTELGEVKGNEQEPGAVEEREGEEQKTEVCKEEKETEEKNGKQQKVASTGESEQQSKPPGEENKEDLIQEEEAEPMEEGEEVNAEESEGEDDENGEGVAEKEDEEEEEVGNLQLAWEVLELAKVIYKRQEAKEAQLSAAQAYLKLGEVGVESENYSQAVEDFQECLAIQQKHLKSHDRLLAETHYQLGLAYTFMNQFDSAIQNFSDSVAVIDQRIALLAVKIEKEEEEEEEEEEEVVVAAAAAAAAALKEMEELKLLLPEIKEKIEDAKESNSIAAQVLKETLSEGSTSGFVEGTGSKPTSTLTVRKVSDGATSSNAATDISHLIRKKRKPEDESPRKENEAKKPKQMSTVNGGDGDAAHSNGVAEKTEEEEAEKPVPMEAEKAVESTA
ncbi:nuclear autoantigenic sperm protein isoform X2 [Latimeria chalumnae]